MFEMKKNNPFPALFDEGTRYPKAEMGYIRAYLRDGRWFNTCFPVGEFKETMANEFDEIYTRFREICPTLGKMRNFCRENAKRIEDWCYEEQYEAYLETPIALYRFVIRFAPGDYNLYLHCYDRYEIPWSDDGKVFDRVIENYDCEVENPYDFTVSMNEDVLMRIFCTAENINWRKVILPEFESGKKYVGNFAEFLKTKGVRA